MDLVYFKIFLVLLLILIIVALLRYYKKWKFRNKESSDPQELSLEEDGGYDNASDKNNADIPEPSGNDIANAEKGDVI